MTRVAISALFAALLSTSAVAQPGDDPIGGRLVQSQNEGTTPDGAEPSTANADSHRVTLQVHYFSYSRRDEWRHLKAAGLTDLQAVHFLLANPPGTNMAAQIPAASNRTAQQ